MPKQYSQDYWTDDCINGTVNIGFTKHFIDDVLGECFQVVPSNTVMVVKGKPMLTIETNCGLKVVRSPVTGTIQYFSDMARDFPDRLTEEDVVITIRPKGVVTAAKVKPKYAYAQVPHVDGNPQWVILDDIVADPRNNNNNNQG